MDKAIRQVAKEIPEKDTESWATNYHVAPTQKLPVIQSNGLVIGMKFSNNYQHVNIRTESILDSNFLQQKFIKDRCLVPAYGFFESKKEKGRSLPYYCYLNNKAPFFMAGIISAAEHTKQPYFTIITCAANELIGKIHDRMPVVITKEDANDFLYADQALSYLKPLPEDLMAMHPVSPKINKGLVNGPEAIAPFEEQGTLF